MLNVGIFPEKFGIFKFGILKIWYFFEKIGIFFYLAFSGFGFFRVSPSAERFGPSRSLNMFGIPIPTVENSPGNSTFGISLTTSGGNSSLLRTGTAIGLKVSALQPNKAV